MNTEGSAATTALGSALPDLEVAILAAVDPP